MKILITGGNGFIAKNLFEQLNIEQTVLSLNRKDLDLLDSSKVFYYLYIDDLIKIVKWFINNKPQKNIYNVCTGNVNDFKTLAEKIIKISGKKLDTIIKTDGFGIEYSGDNSLLMNELKDFEFSLIDESIKTLYDWYDLNKHIIEKDKL